MTSNSKNLASNKQLGTFFSINIQPQHTALCSDLGFSGLGFLVSFLGNLRHLISRFIVKWPYHNYRGAYVETSHQYFDLDCNEMIHQYFHFLKSQKYGSMTQLLSHTFAHLTGSSFRLKAKLLPIKNILGDKYNWVNSVKKWPSF